MNLFAIRSHLDKVLHPVVSVIAKLPLRANHWTVMGAFVGLVCAVALFNGELWTGFALLCARGLIDHIDGFKARNFGQRTTFGAILDDTVDRWVLGIMFTGGCLYLAPTHPHLYVIMGLGITGALSNVITKQSIYAEAKFDGFRKEGKLGHPVDVVGMFGSAEFMIYFGLGLLITAITGNPKAMIAGCWAVAVISHISLLQRIAFAHSRYRKIDPVDMMAEEEPETLH